MKPYIGDLCDDESYEEGAPDPCECLDPDVDVLAGRAHCISCGRSWWMTSEQLQAEAKFQAEADEAYAAEIMAEPSADKQ